MDADRFDTLARSLTTGLRRRTLVAALSAAFAPLLGHPDVTAHDLFAKCKKKSGKAKKKCLKKARKHAAQHAASTVPATCSDGVRNSGETDVDCGGPCRPCADGQGCARQGDCQSRVCTNNVCQAPTCTDNVKNGSETDVDCGGACPGCEYGQTCGGDADCAVPQFGTSACCNIVCAECCDHVDCLICDENGCSPPGDVCENRTCRGCSSATAPATNWCTKTASQRCGFVDPPDNRVPCYCIRTLGGGNVCTFGEATDGDVCQPCASDDDCGSNHVCVNADGCCPRVDDATPATACVFDGCQ